MANSAETSKDAGMFNCPICFYDKPHWHPDAEVEKFRVCEREGSHAQPYEHYTPVSETTKYCRMVPGRDFTSWSITENPHDKLQPRRVYKVTGYEVRSWHTRVSLEGVDGCFNNLDLEDITPFDSRAGKLEDALARMEALAVK